MKYQDVTKRFFLYQELSNEYGILSGGSSIRIESDHFDVCKNEMRKVVDPGRYSIDTIMKDHDGGDRRIHLYKKLIRPDGCGIEDLMLLFDRQVKWMKKLDAAKAGGQVVLCYEFDKLKMAAIQAVVDKYGEVSREDMKKDFDLTDDELDSMEQFAYDDSLLTMKHQVIS